MTRAEILDAAAQIFREKGYHATSMQDIAVAVNLQKASLYHHIDSKQDILVALLDQALDMLIAALQDVQAQPLSPDEKLRLAMRTYLEIIAENGDLATVLLLEHRSLDAKLRKQHVPRRDRFEDIWKEIIAEGQRAGVFDCADADMAAKVLIGALNWTIMWFRPQGKLSMGQIADINADLFINGLHVHTH
jgi:AcrR family transcriptional regulator